MPLVMSGHNYFRIRNIADLKIFVDRKAIIKAQI